MTALALRDGQDFWDDKQLAALAQIGVRNAPNGDLAVFLHQAQKTGLDPFSRQIYMIERQGKWTMQSSIDGLRIVAQRTGEYAGQVGPFWCGPDGIWVDAWLQDGAPAAAKVGVLRAGFAEPLFAVARYDSYCATTREGRPTATWARMPDVMLAKCFDADTEVLTEHGFRRFADVDGARIMQVTPDGLEAVDAVPFAQLYDGPMVTWKSDDLDFAVTPNHDMVTTFGKVEAGAMYATSHTRGPWLIPRLVPPNVKEAPYSDEQIKASAWILADGFARNDGWGVGVGRPRKIEAVRRLGLAVSEGVKSSRGKVATGLSGREVRSNLDQVIFQFRTDDAPLVLDGKCVDLDAVRHLSARQARVLVDTWVEADGHENRKTGVRRLYSSRANHISAFEVAAVIAGYAVSPRRERVSDLSDRPNYNVTISSRDEIGVRRHNEPDRPSLTLTENTSGVVWCVTVPTGQIVVRRNGFSMICGNCAEALALRKAFPQDLSGIYTSDEMDQASGDGPRPAKRAAATVTQLPTQPPASGLGVDELGAAVMVAASEDVLRQIWADGSHLGQQDKAALRDLIRARRELLLTEAAEPAVDDVDAPSGTTPPIVDGEVLD
nr:recombinase RecT [Actinomycetota bacterium]